MFCTLTTCAGCRRAPRSAERFLPCSFASGGFHLGGRYFVPCFSGYHPSCIRAGSPFSSRRQEGKDLVFPKVEYWPNYVCELCMVRAQLGRELGHAGDRWLMQLERVRMLDMAHSTAPSTLAGYQSQLRKVKRFEDCHPGLRVLRTSHLLSPPVGPGITLAWTELHTSVQVLPARGSWETRTPVFNSVRQIRSAVSNYLSWDLIQTCPDTNYFDRRRHHVGPCKVTDTGGYTLFSKGLSHRIGNNPRQSTALLGRHVCGLDNWLDEEYARSNHLPDKLSWTLAGLANVILWLGWLRGGEAFGINQKDVRLILPRDGPAHDLPERVGAILIRMIEDKTHKDYEFDVVISFRCRTGLCAGKWLRRAQALGLWDPSVNAPLFRHPSGKPWTSYFYRHRYLYPGLRLLRERGDPFLARFDGSQPHLSFDYAFWSLHCYRRGARTHCQRSQPDRKHTKATKAQVYEHARWHMKAGSEDIDVTYRAWTLYDKLRITLLCH